MAKSKWIGKKLGNRYLIEEMLGQGGMSAVYKATDPNLKRVVAVKMIHSHLSSDPDFVKRFEEEATAVAQLRHPGIIQVYDFNQDDDVYFMVLEFVPGETIQQHLKRLNDGGRKLSVVKAAEYMADICDAVDYAHQRGMIHRDIKPANLMLNTHGQVILMDFGIAKIVGGQRHTATGAVVGTAMYMSPEQIKGERPDRRTDIYSLGVTLFEMVGGRPPFEADSAMTLMMMHVNDPVPDPRKLNPDVPDDLVAIINKALAKDPNDRFQTCAQMAAALRNVVARIKSGASAATALGGTMIEESPLASANLDATIYESSPAGKGTVVENGPLPPSPMGTVVESGPLSTPQGTVMESKPQPGMATSGGGGNIGGTAIENLAASPAPLPKASDAGMQTRRFKLSLPLVAGGLIGAACLIFGGIFLVNSFMNRGANSATEEPTAFALLSTETFTPTTAPDSTETPAIPTETPTETPIPFTPTPETPYVVITSILLESNVYVVNYEVHNFPESPSLHVHMFFNSVPPEQAGAPNAGPWKLTWGRYGDPPFTGYGPANRPANATQMCALVANPNHSVQLNSGNCMDLP